jgi:hypothetical protein
MQKISGLVILLASMLVTACSFQSKTSLLNPVAPSTVVSEASSGSSSGSSSSPSPAAPSSSSPASSTSTESPFAGTWASGTIGNLPNISSCTNLQWQISNLSPTSVAGSVSAVCVGSVNVTANLTGQLEGEDIVHLTANGQAVASGITCGFSLTGVGHRESNVSVRLQYQGTTCLGPVSGSELLRKSSPVPPAHPAPSAPEPAPAPEPEPEPDDEVFGCTKVLPNKGDYVACIHSHIRPSNEIGAFEVTKRVAWGLRSEGAGLMQKPFGDNIVHWRGYSFTASRIMYPDGHYYKVVTDVGPGGANGPSWQDSGLGDRSQYLPALNPALP